MANPPTYKSNILLNEYFDENKLDYANRLGERIICPIIHPALSAKDNIYIANSIIEAVQKIEER